MGLQPLKWHHHSVTEPLKGFTCVQEPSRPLWIWLNWIQTVWRSGTDTWCRKEENPNSPFSQSNITRLMLVWLTTLIMVLLILCTRARVVDETSIYKCITALTHKRSWPMKCYDWPLCFVTSGYLCERGLATTHLSSGEPCPLPSPPFT